MNVKFLPSHPASLILHPSLSPGHRCRLLDGFLDCADHPERLLWKIIMLPVDNLAETSDGVFQIHVLSSDQ